MSCDCDDDIVLVLDDQMEIVVSGDDVQVLIDSDVLECDICEDEITLLEVDGGIVYFEEDSALDVIRVDDALELLECCEQGLPGAPGIAVWDSSAAYSTEDIVFFEGSFYLALTDNINSEPDSNPSDWELIVTGGGGAVDSVNGQTGVVVINADDVPYDNTYANSVTDNYFAGIIEQQSYDDKMVDAFVMFSGWIQVINETFLESIVAGAGVTIDNTDPQNPIISATALPQQIYLLQNQELTNTYAYVGYEATEGDWYIYRRTRANNLREYAFGISSYNASWNNRASLTYA